MALPETIPVKYTEEEAEFISVRPVVRQTFRLEELVDMILGVTGKDASRIRQILRAGTLVFHSYRYWWPGFGADEEELQKLLAQFPDAEPQREFRAQDCTAIVCESGTQLLPATLELTREEVSRKRLFRRQSLWDFLLELAAKQAPKYQNYAYDRHADVYVIEIIPEQRERIARMAAELAPRTLRLPAVNLHRTERILWICPRGRSGKV